MYIQCPFDVRLVKLKVNNCENSGVNKKVNREVKGFKCSFFWEAASFWILGYIDKLDRFNWN